MIAFGNFLIAVGQVLSSLVTFFLILLLIRFIISFVNPDQHNPVVRFLMAATEPFLRPIRRKLPPLGGMFDLSVLVFALFLIFIQAFIAQSLLDYGQIIRAS